MFLYMFLFLSLCGLCYDPYRSCLMTILDDI